MRRKALTVLVLLFMLGTAAQALYVSTGFGDGADGWISNDNQSSSYYPDKVHNTTGMHVRYNGGGSRFRGIYLRFDVSQETDPFGADTKLLLTETWAKGSAKTLEVYGLIDGDAGENWDETTLCYNNAPGMVTDPMPTYGNFAIDARLVMLGTITVPAAPAGTPSGGGNVNVKMWSDPTSLPLADFLNADTNGLVTLVILNASGTSSNNCEDRFASKEDTDPTKLAPALVPEPATLVLLGLGGLMALGRKRGS